MALQPWAGAGTQPWNRVVWPPSGRNAIAPRTVSALGTTPYGWYDGSALRVPAVGRATAVYTATIRQCPLDAYRGAAVLGRPRILARPDPTAGRAWFVGVNVEDYLWHGNSICLVTSRNAEGWPATVRWIPAVWVSIRWTPGDLRHSYWVNERELPFDDVIHVRRSADRSLPFRGVGVLEQYLATFDRVAAEEDYEAGTLSGAGVPSVAIIANNPQLSGEEAGEGKTVWMDKFDGPGREPAILPYGTQVIPLSWSPADSQMIEARKMSLQDVANAFNLDGYWLGAPTASLTYRSPAPLYTALVRTSLEPVLADFEEAWGDAWLPSTTALRFDRLQLTRDDFGSAVPALVAASGGPFIALEEARQYVGLPSAAPAGIASPLPTEAQPPEPPAEAPPEEEAP